MIVSILKLSEFEEIVGIATGAHEITASGKVYSDPDWTALPVGKRVGVLRLFDRFHLRIIEDSEV